MVFCASLAGGSYGCRWFQVLLHELEIYRCFLLLISNSSDVYRSATRSTFTNTHASPGHNTVGSYEDKHLYQTLSGKRFAVVSCLYCCTLDRSLALSPAIIEQVLCCDLKSASCTLHFTFLALSSLCRTLVASFWIVSVSFVEHGVALKCMALFLVSMSPAIVLLVQHYLLLSVIVWASRWHCYIQSPVADS